MLFGTVRIHVLVFPSDARPLTQRCSPPLRPQYKSTLLKLEIAKLFGKHAQCLDGKDEFVVRVGDHAIIISCQRSCSSRKEGVSWIKTYQLLLKTPSMPSCSHSPLDCCLDMISLTAFSIGALSGYPASINAITTQAV
jgi:hypothetical protein